MPLCRTPPPPIRPESILDPGSSIPVPITIDPSSSTNDNSSLSSADRLLYAAADCWSQLVADLSSNASQADILGNRSSASLSPIDGKDAKGSWGGLLSDIQLIKAIVLIVVVSLLLLSTCTIIFRTFSVFSGKKDDQME